MVSKKPFVRSLKLKNAKVIDLKLLPALSLQAFKNLLPTRKQDNKLTMILIDADVLFPLGTSPFLYLQHLKEQNPKLSFIFLISQNLLGESLHRRFLKIAVLFEKLVYQPLDQKNLPFKNKLQAKNFFLSLNENQRLILRLLVRGAGKIPASLKVEQEYLEKLKIVKKHYGRWKLISPLLEKAALEINQEINEVLRLKNEEIYIGQQKITEQFSPSQQKIVRVLLQNKGKVVSREKIAETLWAEEWTEKYSDWAIDQLISKLRKKLTRLWINPEILATRKRRGVILR